MLTKTYYLTYFLKFKFKKNSTNLDYFTLDCIKKQKKNEMF